MPDINFEQFEPVTIALVHGRWGSGQQFDKLRPYLEPYVAAVVTPDLPSDQPGTTYDDNAEAVAEAIDDHENVHVWGHSRGGETAVRVAVRRPDIVKHLGYFCARMPRAKDQPLPPRLPPRLTPAYKLWERTLSESLTEDNFPVFAPNKMLVGFLTFVGGK